MPTLNKQFPRLLPEPIKKNVRVADLIDTTFKAYNAARLGEACGCSWKRCSLGTAPSA